MFSTLHLTSIGRYILLTMAQVTHDPNDAKRFNRICRLIALAWLVIVLPISFIRSPSYQDFAALYTGGLVTRLGAWNVLYPTRIGDSRYYIGEAGQDQEKPGLARITDPRGMKEWCAFLNPPWQAPPLLPLGWMSFQQAHWTVVVLNVFCMWGVAWAAGRSYELCLGRSSRAAGLITLLTACSMLAYRAIRVGNLSPPVAFCIAVVVWDLLGRLDSSGFLGGFAAAWGALGKLATAALFPLAIVMRRWRIVGWALALFALDILITWRLAGAAIFHEFFTVIAPSLARSSINPGNKSLQGLLLRVTNQTPLSPAISIPFHLLQWSSLALILWLMLRHRREQRQLFWSARSHVFAAATALIAWLLIFSPLCWEHYFLYLCPFWGWLIWEGSLGRARMIAVVAAIAMNWFPLPVLRWLHIPEPFNSYMLFGLIIMFVIALVRLSTPRTSDSLGVSQG
jgi:hypothetical protein